MKKIVKNVIAATVVAVVVNDTVNLVRYTKQLKKDYPQITAKAIVKSGPEFWMYCFEIARDTGYVVTTPAQLDHAYRAFLNENYYVQ